MCRKYFFIENNIFKIPISILKKSIWSFLPITIWVTLPVLFFYNYNLRIKNKILNKIKFRLNGICVTSINIKICWSWMYNHLIRIFQLIKNNSISEVWLIHFICQLKYFSVFVSIHCQVYTHCKTKEWERKNVRSFKTF